MTSCTQMTSSETQTSAKDYNELLPCEIYMYCVVDSQQTLVYARPNYCLDLTHMIMLLII